MEIVYTKWTIEKPKLVKIKNKSYTDKTKQNCVLKMYNNDFKFCAMFYILSIVFSHSLPEI